MDLAPANPRPNGLPVAATTTSRLRRHDYILYRGRRWLTRPAGIQAYWAGVRRFSNRGTVFPNAGSKHSSQLWLTFERRAYRVPCRRGDAILRRPKFSASKCITETRFRTCRKIPFVRFVWRAKRSPTSSRVDRKNGTSIFANFDS